MIRYSHYALLSLTLSINLVAAVSASSFSIDDANVTSAKTLTDAQTGTLTSTGILSVSGSSVAVTIIGDATINNNGLIAQTGTGRAIYDNTAGAILTLNNYGTITSVGDDVIKVGKGTAGIILDNQGTIWQKGTTAGSGQALDLTSITASGSSIINGSLSNTSALIRADGDDALRPGDNMSITNYGTIISTGTVNTKCTGTCTNEAKAQDGIDVQDSTGVSVYNYGLISGPRHGITADTEVSVTNYEGGTIIGNNGSGVGSDGTGSVINYGTITGAYAGAGNAYDHSASNGGTSTADNGDGDGVDIDGIATIENYGIIQGLGAGGVDSSGNPNGAEGIAAGGGTIVNHEGALIYGESVGILIDDGANGTVMSSGRGTSTATGGVATITNSGTIQGATKAAIGLVGDYDDVIVNNATGVIIGGSSAVLVDELSSTTAGAAIQMGAGNDTLTNYGTITGQNGLAIDMGSGDDTLSLLGGTISGTIVGGTGNDTVVLGSAQTLSARTTISGFENLTTQSGAILETRLSGTSAEMLSFSGTVTLADGTIIKPVIVGSVANGLQSTILTAGTLSTDVSKLSILDTSALVNFSLSQTENDLILTSRYDSSLVGTMSTNDKALLNALDTQNSSSLLTSLYALSSSEAIEGAIKQLSPATNNSLLQTVNVAQNTLFGAFTHRMNGISSPTQSGLSAGDETEGTYWMELLGNTAKQKSYKGSDGYRIDAAGVAIGYERELSTNELLGFSGGYTGAKSYGKDDSQGDNTTINSFHVGVYYNQNQKAYTLNSALIGTFNHYNAKRVVSYSGFDESEKSSYDGYALGTLVEVGFPLQGGFKPLIGAQYTYNQTQSYDEKGGSGALHVASGDASSLKSIVGTEYAYRDAQNANYLVGLRYLHEFADEATTTAGFLNSASTFSLTNAQAPKDALQLDLAYEFLRDTQNTMRIGYTLEVKEDYLAHQLSLKMTF